MAIKLIATDMDGTLLNDQKEISQENLAAIKAADKLGIKTVLATGRPLNGVKRYIKEMGITGPEEYVLTYNGAYVQDLAGGVVVEHTLGYQDFLKWDYLTNLYETYVHFETLHHFYTPNVNLNTYMTAESFLTDMPIRIRSPRELTEDIKISKIMVTDHPEALNKFIEKVPQNLYDEYQITQSEDFFLEVNNKQASKGKSLLELSQKLGLKPDEVMILGDQGNDLPMFEQPGFLKVAMGNAIPTIKDHADFVTATNQESGFAKAVNKFALKKES